MYLSCISKWTEFTKNIEHKRNALLVSIDLRKAFEVIRHDVLIKKIENSDIRNPMLN